jgi:multicomponent K+:H+ antiporter subunit A
MNLFLVVALPFATALLLFAQRNRARDVAASIAMLFTLASTALLATYGPAVFGGTVVSFGWDWLPLAGARFAFRLDGLAFMFAGLVLVLGALIILYARYYLSDRDPIARFYAFFMLFMGAMLGVVLADNLILLVVFWELTSIASFLLIGYWQHRSDARQGARMALTVTGLGGLALLAGVLLIGQIVGSYSLTTVLASGDIIRASELYVPALLLILLGAFTKSAQFPFHFWLPHAMAAPTPVSAYLHSATMVKAGVFLLARLYPALAGSEEWFFVVSAAGLTTLLVGAYVAVFQHDLKGLLAYSTISHLGLITLLFGLNSPLAAVAGVFHILNHATFKASLFMAAGIIDHESGSRDMRNLNGLWKYMPVTGVLAIVASSAMAGVPVLNGFLSKEMFFAETLALESHRLLEWLVPIVATLAAAFSVAYSMRFIHDVFWNGEPRNLPKQPHDPPAWMLVPVGVLAIACLLVGLLPNLTIGPLLAVSAAATLGGNLPDYTLKIWHGINLPLGMSVFALVVGVVIYFLLQRLFRLHDLVHLPRGGKEIFDYLLERGFSATRAITSAIQTDSLQRSIVLTIGAAIVAGVWPFLSGGEFTAGPLTLTPVSLPFVLVWLVGCTATVWVAITHSERLAALLALGAVGLIVSVAFAVFSAPDLALTQLLVEVVSIVLMMLAIYYLPRRSLPERSTARRWRDVAISALAGCGVAALVYAVLTRPFESIATFHLDKSLPEGFGTNVVNVIIVDFRGFDTLGEITVLGIAGLIVFALLERLVPRAIPDQDAGVGTGARPLMLELVGRALLPLAIMVALFMFLRGHNLPGGGFIAGLVLAVSLLLPYIASGAKWVEDRLRPDYHKAIGLGLLCAGATGIGSFWFSHPFLTSSYWSPAVPIVGKIPVASAMFFDIGVFATVTGATMLALAQLGKVSAARSGAA